MNLQLPLKKQWFEMTKSGIKTEDYREITPYWVERLLDTSKSPYILTSYSFLDIANDFDEIIESEWDVDEAVNYIFEKYNFSFKSFTTNIIILGHPSSTDIERFLKLEHAGIEIRTGNPDWGAEPDKLYFVIKHGERINL